MTVFRHKGYVQPLFFGAFRQPGHLLYARDMFTGSLQGFPHALFKLLDGVLVSSEREPYDLVKTTFEGLGYAIYSFVDYSSDKRRNSNSNFFFDATLDKELTIGQLILRDFNPLAEWYTEKGITLTYEGKEVSLVDLKKD